MSGEAESAYGPQRAAYDLKKLRGKGLVRKIRTSRRYELRTNRPTSNDRSEKVIRPLLAASQDPQPQNHPRHPTPVDQNYAHLRAGMRELFIALGVST